MLCLSGAAVTVPVFSHVSGLWTVHLLVMLCLFSHVSGLWTVHLLVMLCLFSHVSGLWTVHLLVMLCLFSHVSGLWTVHLLVLLCLFSHVSGLWTVHLLVMLCLFSHASGLWTVHLLVMLCLFSHVSGLWTVHLLVLLHPSGAAVTVQIYFSRHFQPPCCCTVQSLRWNRRRSRWWGCVRCWTAVTSTCLGALLATWWAPCHAWPSLKTSAPSSATTSASPPWDATSVGMPQLASASLLGNDGDDR